MSNLYTYFLVRAADALTYGGECVAIISRSWMNGDYFKDFRKWLLCYFSIDALAVYASRKEHFKDMDILQEIMLIKISRSQQASRITVYPHANTFDDFGHQKKESYTLKNLLMGTYKILRIQQTNPKLEKLSTLAEQGLWVSTGKLVWFRNRDILFRNHVEGSYPLYWSDNQNGGITHDPVTANREQWVTSEAQDRHVILQQGSYCLVNRFSSKEQAHRIYVSYIHTDKKFVVDNRFNYIHQGTWDKQSPSMMR